MKEDMNRAYGIRVFSTGTQNHGFAIQNDNFG